MGDLRLVAQPLQPPWLAIHLVPSRHSSNRGVLVETDEDGTAITDCVPSSDGSQSVVCSWIGLLLSVSILCTNTSILAHFSRNEWISPAAYAFIQVVSWAQKWTPPSSSLAQTLPTKSPSVVPRSPERQGRRQGRAPGLSGLQTPA